MTRNVILTRFLIILCRLYNSGRTDLNYYFFLTDRELIYVFFTNKMGSNAFPHDINDSFKDESIVAELMDSSEYELEALEPILSVEKKT